MILPIQNLNIVGAEIDWMKCFKKSSDPKFEHFRAKSIGGNGLMIPPIKSLNIFGAQIDWRKCFEKSFLRTWEMLSLERNSSSHTFLLGRQSFSVW